MSEEKEMYVFFVVDDSSLCEDQTHGNQELRIWIGKNPPYGSRFVPKNWNITYDLITDDTGCKLCGYRTSYINVELRNSNSKTYYNTYFYTYKQLQTKYKDQITRNFS